MSLPSLPPSFVSSRLFLPPALPPSLPPICLSPPYLEGHRALGVPLAAELLRLLAYLVSDHDHFVPAQGHLSPWLFERVEYFQCNETSEF